MDESYNNVTWTEHYINNTDCADDTVVRLECVTSQAKEMVSEHCSEKDICMEMTNDSQPLMNALIYGKVQNQIYTIIRSFLQNSHISVVGQNSDI